MQGTVRICMALLMFCVSYASFGQFKHSEFYGVAKFSIGMGMNSYTYQSVLEGTSADVPQSMQIDLGTGFIPEFGLGFKVSDFFYVETSLFFSKTQNFYSTQAAGLVLEEGYSFNRSAILLNGKYYVPVNKKFVMDFFMGVSYSMPQELTVQMSGYSEVINYAGSNGFQGGFAGNFILGAVSISGGLRYRLERFSIKPNQVLPQDFEIMNPSFDRISSSGIDLIFSCQYNF